MTRTTLSSRHSRWRLTLAPERGACALGIDARLGATWHTVAHPTSEPAWDADQRLRFSNYALLPYSNRVAFGRLLGEAAPLPPNLAGHPHPLHGIGWLAAWRAAPATGRELRLVLDWPGGPAWPWPLRAEQRLRLLGADVLQFDLSLLHTGSTGRMPAGLGWHPYFRADPQLRLCTQLQSQQVNGVDGLPSGWTEAPEALRRGQPQTLSQLHGLDNAFSGWRGAATLAWPAGPQLEITAQGALRRHCVLYTPADESFFCFEPVSHANGAFNAQTPSGRSGLQWLAPGQSLRGGMRWRLLL